MAARQLIVVAKELQMQRDNLALGRAQPIFNFKAIFCGRSALDLLPVDY
jgi:hypothetical protein